MSQDSLCITYPAIFAGTQKSEVSFLQGRPDLVSLFKPGEDGGVRRFFITDATVASLECMQPFVSLFEDDECGQDRLLILGSGEPYKTMESVLRIVTGAVDGAFTRNDVFVGIGGGVICDITAFAASIYKRGVVSWFVPTTLLAMVDAAIGGKSGCDYESYKNIIGSFHPSEKIYFFPEFVQYLPENQYNSGLSEAFKTALLFDRELFDIFKTQSDRINGRDRALLDDIIRRCATAKAKIVEEDFTEQGIRATLNLGHTFAHALETIAGLGTVTHGAAVAWGIGRAVEVAFRKELCKEAYRNELFGVLEQYSWETASVPSCLRGGSVGERFLTVMRKDKKNISSKIRLILTKGITDTVIEETDDADILAVLK